MNPARTPEGSPDAPRAGGAAFAAIGGILGALAASSCCILPLALFTLGVSGAWISNVTALEPYQPLFFAVTAGFLAAGYYLVYRRPKPACAGNVCTRPLRRRTVVGALWMATTLVVAAIAFRVFGTMLLGT